MCGKNEYKIKLNGWTNKQHYVINLRKTHKLDLAMCTHATI